MTINVTLIGDIAFRYRKCRQTLNESKDIENNVNLILVGFLLVLN